MDFSPCDDDLFYENTWVGKTMGGGDRWADENTPHEDNHKQKEKHK